MKFNLRKIHLDLKVNWKLSRGGTLFKENFIFEINEGAQVFKGEIAPNLRYGETEDKIRMDFERFVALAPSFDDLNKIFSMHEYSHAFMFGVESAYTHREASLQKKSVQEFLGLKIIDTFKTSYSVPIMEEADLEEYLSHLHRFPYIKIKVSEENAISFVKTISKYISVPLRVDGNEAWSTLESYLEFEKAVENLNIEFIEQPFKSIDTHLYKKLKPISRFEIMADESIENAADFDELQTMFHSVNVKLMKAGGYQTAIKLLNEARMRGMKTMIGCMIETSLGIQSAMYLGSLADYYDLDGSLLIKNDPYEFILEENGQLKFKS